MVYNKIITLAFRLRAAELRLVVGIIVSSDAAFLEYSLPAVRPFVDHIVIVEGCDARWVRIGNAKDDGSSLDNTSSVIKAEQDRHGEGLASITYIEPKVYPHRNAQRQRCLDEMEKQGAEICLILDADEFYHPSSFHRIKEAFSETDIVCARWPFFNFYTYTRRFLDIQPMERCFRLLPGMKYPDIESGQYLMLESGEKIWDNTKTINSVVCYHYNRILDGSRLVHKMRFYFERDYGLSESIPIPANILSSDDRAAITKDPSAGVLVPLENQPPFAQFLIYSQIAPETSAATMADLCGRWWPLASARSKEVSNFQLHKRLEEIPLLVNLGIAAPAALSQLTSKTGIDRRPTFGNLVSFERAYCQEVSSNIQTKHDAICTHDVKDIFGHPFFLKELYRDLLQDGNFPGAEALLRQTISQEAPSWSLVLLARALESKMRRSEALKVWARELAINPANEEARQAHDRLLAR